MLTIFPEPLLLYSLTIIQLLLSLALLPLSLRYFPLKPHNAIYRTFSYFALGLFLNLTLINLSDAIKVARLARQDFGGVDDILDTWFDTTAMCGQILLTGVRFGGFRYVVWIRDLLAKDTTSSRTRTFTFYWNLFARVVMAATVVIFIATGTLWTLAKIRADGTYLGVDGDTWMGLFGGWYVIIGSLILGVALVGIVQSQRYLSLSASQANVDTKQRTNLAPVSHKSYRRLYSSLSVSSSLTLLGLLVYLQIDGEIGIKLASLTFRLHQFGLLIYMTEIRKFVHAGDEEEPFIANP